MTDSDFDRLRRYESAEVTQKLNLKPSWLRNWVTKGLVPVRRSGTERGVWFTYEDLLEIGRRVPELASRTTGPGVPGPDDVESRTSVYPGETADLFSRYAALLPADQAQDQSSR